MNIVRQLIRRTRVQNFCRTRPATEEPILPQMVLDLDTESLRDYFHSYKHILSIESWIFSFERALKLAPASDDLTTNILHELPTKLENQDPLFLNLVLDLCAKHDLRFENWMQVSLEQNEQILSIGLKEKTYVWILENLPRESPALDRVHREFHAQFRVYPKPEHVFWFEDSSPEVDLEQIQQQFENLKSTVNLVKSKENLVRLFSVYSSKIASLDHLSQLELRLALETPNLTKSQLLILLENCSQLNFRLPNLRLVDLLCEFLVLRASKLNFDDSLKMLESFANLNYANNFLLAQVSKQLDEHFLSKENLSRADLDWIGKAVFFLAKLDFLKDELFETFAAIFRREIEQLSSESISLFAFAHSSMVSTKLRLFKGKFSKFR